jgi:hypothetical protein
MKKQNSTTWLDLYNYLYNKAHDMNSYGTFDWQAPIEVYDGDSEEVKIADTYYLDGKFVLITGESDE